MKDLTFLVNWGDNKETAWSGTNYSLYKALSKYYNINDINLKGSHWVNSFMRHIFKMDSTTIDYYRRHFLGHKLSSIKGDVFQFSEVLSNNNCRNTYMYVDNTVSFVNYLRNEKPDIFAVSAFQNSNAKVFEKRGKEQDDYIRSCTGLFTMGHWLKDWLVGKGMDGNRIFVAGGGHQRKR